MRQDITRQTLIPIQRRVSSGNGGLGIDVALRREQMYLDQASGLYSSDKDTAARTRALLDRLSQKLLFDSDRRGDLYFAPEFFHDDGVCIPTPNSYRPLTSPAGRTILDRIDAPPFRHLKDWPALREIEPKSSDSEAEGVRLFGAANALVNIRPIHDRIKNVFEAAQAIKGSQTWLSLAELGVPLGDGLRVDLFTSLAGGQGSGLIVLLLALVALQIQSYREDVKIHLHLFLPGFHPAQNKVEAQDQQMKVLAVLRDLAALKGAGRPLSIPFPDGPLYLEARHSRELYNHLHIYEPAPTEAERYRAFVTRVGRTVVAGELSAIAEDLRRARSNANNLAHRSSLLSVVGGTR